MMNLVEHFIVTVHAVEDVTNKFKKKEPSERILAVDLTYNCYGRVKRQVHYFRESEWNQAVDKGYFLA